MLGAAFAGLVLAGCGEAGEEASPAPDYQQALAGAPAPLASLYDQANELLPGGLDAYNERIAGLKGHPAVVNIWGFRRGPCRAEFPVFQKVSAGMGKKVAFLGVNSEDNDDAAKTFLSPIIRFPTRATPIPTRRSPRTSVASGTPGPRFTTRTEDSPTFTTDHSPIRHRLKMR